MLKKASKRLVISIAALIGSVILCIGVCLAWFAFNNDVNGNGLQTQLSDDDIVSMQVTAYYLNDSVGGYVMATEYGGNKDDGGNVILDGINEISVDGDNDGVINGGDAMRPFAYGNSYSTAVLFKIDYVLKSDSVKTFRIFAECPYDTADTRLTVEKKDSGDNFTSKLSNAVKFYEVKEVGDGAPYEPAEDGSGNLTAFTFINSEHEKSFKLDFYDGITVKSADLIEISAGGLQGTAYLIMDYDSERFSYLSSLVLENGGNLSSGLELTGDITIGIEAYDPGKTVVPVSMEADGFAPNATFVQQANESDLMTQGWQFVVTYSDGTKKIVKVSGNHGDNLIIDGLATNRIGDYSAQVTYTEDGITLTCGVDYTITEADNTAVAATGVTIDKTTATLKPGETNSVTLTATVAPADADNKSVSWTSSDTSVATVSDGVVTAVSAGSAEITVTTVDGGYTAICTVTVEAAEYTLTFNANGHGTAPAAQTIAEGGVAIEPVAPTADGYTFGGWYKEAACANAFSFGTAITSDMTLYAKWTADEYTITYILDGGVNASDNPENYTVETETITLNAPVKDGYTFVGWYNGESLVETVVKGSTGDLTLTAKWTVKLTAAGGDNLIDGLTVSSVDIAQNTQTSLGNYVSITCSDGAYRIISTSVESYTTAVKSTANKKTLVISADTNVNANIKVTVYFTVTDSDGNSKSGSVTVVSGSDTQTASVAQNGVGSVTYVLNDGETISLSTTSNSVAVVGVYAESA